VIGSGRPCWAAAARSSARRCADFKPAELVLSKLRAMPIERWRFRGAPGVTHIGPVAQDFYEAFGLGTSDTTIGHMDVSGISLRAIQALEARTREQNDALVRENEILKAELAVLRGRLSQLEARQP
jgi:trimeric autotransporter adhesin